MRTGIASCSRTSTPPAESASRRSSATTLAPSCTTSASSTPGSGFSRVRHGDDLYALVNNAARTEFRSFWEIDLGEWDDVLATNLAARTSAAVSSARTPRPRSGRIVNLASDAAFAASGASGAHYAASKAGVVAVTRRAATELAPYGVTVNAVAPAAIDGPLAQEVLRERLDEKLADIPVGRLGRPEEVAALVSFLVSDDAGYITGATLDVNGGVLMR